MMKMSFNHKWFTFFLFLNVVFGGSEVKFLPGFDGPLPFHLQTGYIGVDEGEKVQVFYYFVKSETNPSKDPLILWLVGGPGCSGISALMYEIGPLIIDGADDGGLPKLTSNPYSWTEMANIIFIDMPVGTGFSYATTPEAAHSTGLQSCNQVYQFLLKWLVENPEFISNPFYVGGHSYTGIIIPTIVKLISDGNEKGVVPRINVQGYAIGNGLTFADEDNYQIPYAHGMALISDELYESLKNNCKGNYLNVDPNNFKCLQDLHTFNQLVDGLYKEQILDPTCESLTQSWLKLSQRTRSVRRRRELIQQLSAHKCYTWRHQFVPIWTNDPRVQEALHIREGTIGLWKRCNKSLPYTDAVWDVTSYHAYLSTKGFRSLIYNGDHDMTITFLSTQAWIKSLGYPIIDEWRQWLVQGQIAGYTRTYANNMTFATIKGGAHVAPESHPMESKAMFKRWISHQPL